MDGFVVVVDFLKVFLKFVSEIYGVVVKVIVIVDDLEKIVVDDDVDVVVLCGWWCELFGDMVLKLKCGEVVIIFCNC